MGKRAVVAIIAVAVIAASFLLWVHRSAQSAVPPGSPDQPTLRSRAVRCASVDSEPDLLAGWRDMRVVASDLYAAIIRDRRGRVSTPLVVESTSIPFIEPPTRSIRSQVQAFPASVNAVAMNGHRRCYSLTSAQFPAGTYMVAYAELADGIRNLRDFWSSFPTRFDGAKEWWAFSWPWIDKERRDAAVFYESFCEAACGESAWVWLHRDAIDQPWRVAQLVQGWVG